jgi:hypothetical protein
MACHSPFAGALGGRGAAVSCASARVGAINAATLGRHMMRQPGRVVALIRLIFLMSHSNVAG